MSCTKRDMAVDTRPEILDSARCRWNAVTPATALLLPVSCCGEAARDSTGVSTGEPGGPGAGGVASGASHGGGAATCQHGHVLKWHSWY